MTLVDDLRRDAAATLDRWLLHAGAPIRRPAEIRCVDPYTREVSWRMDPNHPAVLAGLWDAWPNLDRKTRARLTREGWISTTRGCQVDDALAALHAAGIAPEDADLQWLADATAGLARARSEKVAAECRDWERRDDDSADGPREVPAYVLARIGRWDCDAKAAYALAVAEYRFADGPLPERPDRPWVRKVDRWLYAETPRDEEEVF